MGLYELIFGKKEEKIVPTDNTPLPVLSATNWQPSAPVVLTGSVAYLKPPALTVPFTNSFRYLDPRMEGDMSAFIAEVEGAGLHIGFSCTARLFRCQVALYAQGRQPLTEINRLRKLACMQEIGATEANKIVTWTLVSKHLVNYDDTDPNNDYSQAFDFFLINNKKAYWDVKASVNKNQIPDYQEVGTIAESFGWEWGGRWKNPDYPHIQLRA